MNPKKNSTRRQFLQTTTAAAGATWLAGCATPPAARKGAASPNGKLNIAAIGVGGKGAGDIAQTSAGQNVVAICDVDDRTLNIAAKKYTKAAKYHDWRRMLERNDIDAVTVSTPDHMH